MAGISIRHLKEAFLALLRSNKPAIPEERPRYHMQDGACLRQQAHSIQFRVYERQEDV